MVPAPQRHVRRSALSRDRGARREGRRDERDGRPIAHPAREARPPDRRDVRRTHERGQDGMNYLGRKYRSNDPREGSRTVEVVGESATHVIAFNRASGRHTRIRKTALGTKRQTGWTDVT